MFEENYHGSLLKCKEHFSAKTVKGEIVIVVAGKNSKLKLILNPQMMRIVNDENFVIFAYEKVVFDS